MSAPGPAGAGDADAWALEATTDGADGTRALAGRLAGICRPGDVLLLVGDLGAGKTTFAQGFGAALGVEGPVTSPTFTLVRQYPCAGPPGVRQLIHADVYRLASLAEVADLALAELVEEGAVALVEWGERAAPALGPSTLTVTLVPEPAAAGSGPEAADEVRRLSLVGRGPDWAGRRQQVASALAAAEGPS